jgi:hypothetical protein
MSSSWLPADQIETELLEHLEDMEEEAPRNGLPTRDCDDYVSFSPG